MEHETSQNLIKVELTVKQLTSILINFDYLNEFFSYFNSANDTEENK